MEVNPDIFKAYDIRGVYPEEINEDVAEYIGRAFADFSGATKVVVGRDIRVSGEKLHTSLIKGIIKQGVSVVDVGLVSTDMFYHACGSLKLPGVNVTASHNPAEYNGFKMVKQMPDLVSGEKIREFALRGNFKNSATLGSVESLDIKSGYAEKVLSLVDKTKIASTKIVVDPANGMGGMNADVVYKYFPLEITKLFYEPDGTFPNHGGDPLKEENRIDLEERVKKESADLGFALDTDADRFFAVDSTGAYVPSDYLGALLSKYILEKNGGGTIVHDAIIGWAVRDLVSEAGGTAFMSQVGHVFIKTEMEKSNAIFGLEKSGHYYLPDFYFAESGVGVSLILLEMLGSYGKTLDELVAPLREKYHMIEQTNTQVKDPDATIALIKSKYASKYKIDELDGISIIADNWHANVRKSNTEPVVRLNVEAIHDKSLLEEKRDELLKLIHI